MSWLRKIEKKLDCGRRQRYEKALRMRLNTWYYRLSEYKMWLVKNYTLPHNITQWIFSINPKSVFKEYTYSVDDIIPFIHMDIRTVSTIFITLKTTMQTLLNQRDFYIKYADTNKTYDFVNKPFVIIKGVGYEETLCYITNVEKDDTDVTLNGIIFTGPKPNILTEETFVYEWCRFVDMTEHDDMFRIFLKKYRNHLLAEHQTVAKINEETEFMINEWNKQKNYE